MGELAWGTRTFFTRGLRAIGKAKMRLGMCLCRDNGYEDRAFAMLEEAGVPLNWEEFPSDESDPLRTEPFPAQKAYYRYDKESQSCSFLSRYAFAIT